MRLLLKILVVFFLTIGCSSNDSGGDDNSEQPTGELTVSYVLFGGVSLSNNSEIKLADRFVVKFNKNIGPNASSFALKQDSTNIPVSVEQGETNTEIIVIPTNTLEEGKSYTFSILDNLTADDGSIFNGKNFNFTIKLKPLVLLQIKAGNDILDLSRRNSEIPLDQDFTLAFSHPITSINLLENVNFNPNTEFSVEQIDDVTLKINASSVLDYWRKYELIIDASLGETVGRDFSSEYIELFTTYDETNKFPLITDEELLTRIQEETFSYFWDFGHPVSGMARERHTSNEVVTTGGTGFGLMSMIVAIERGFISRNDAINRWETIISFLETADRFHGVWPHWLNGTTGEVVPFSQFDNGADLVETAFLIQGLLSVYQYLDSGNTQENILKNKIKTLWEDVEWNWFTKGGENVLYWHWSPNYDWQMNLKIQGHNETQIVYVLAASSPTHPIAEIVYDEGYAQSGNMVNGDSFYGYNLPLGNNYGGPLFFSHYSYLGLDPRNLQDEYANYWTQNVNHSLINYSYCEENPENYIGYYNNCWGLTASDSNDGYSAHSPTNDLGVITPTASIASLPYSPTESMEAIRFFYYKIGDRVWGDYGFIDAFNPTEEWYAASYLAIDQGPQIVMIENYRTGLLWNLFMQNEDIQNGLNTLGFSY
ncbi:glucoamylase family protein [Flavivirga sp. 57AJ16]|uniref:glucoamylase family protein n=1 Tax=Flavivirga sp. 57AJ16 TaxID=3025307 RepID=UPI002365B4C5|nr:glucoamylase family protein [Flavivirga sp. 57AJ16]MDD7887535.1 glucoamylase family protein [Flavivirga sp. 57AJ16]